MRVRVSQVTPNARLIQLVRVLVLHTSCHRFESCILHHSETVRIRNSSGNSQAKAYGGSSPSLPTNLTLWELAELEDATKIVILFNYLLNFELVADRLGNSLQNCIKRVKFSPSSPQRNKRNEKKEYDSSH